MKTLIWKCCVDDLTEGRYDMIIGRDLLKNIVIDIQPYDNTIDFDEGPYWGYTTSIIK